MATPVVPTATQFGWAWLKAHERLVMLAMVLAFGTFGIGKVYDVAAAHKEAAVLVAQQKSASDEKQLAAVTAQATATASQYQAMVDALTKQNAALAAAVAQRNTGLAVQQKTDSSSTAADLAVRWSVLVPTVLPTVTSSGVSLTVQQARDTVVELEQVPVLIQNLKDETTISANKEAELEKSDLLVNDLHVQISALNIKSVDDAKTFAAQIAAAKAEGKKSKIKAFKWGFVTGFVTGLFAGHSGL